MGYVCVLQRVTLWQELRAICYYALFTIVFKNYPRTLRKYKVEPSPNVPMIGREVNLTKKCHNVRGRKGFSRTPRA